MAEAARIGPRHHVLEIGTGCGYGAAVLAHLAHAVVSIEIRPTLARDASARLQRLGFGNVTVVQADGSTGWPAQAPYDAIVVTAATPNPSPRLLQQLSVNAGRLVAPVGSMRRQQLMLVERSGDLLRTHKLGDVRFVPLRGVAGFDALDADRRN
jgi:protein-L-isoaspartate(D-aspartate) O-methyltransferase